MGVSQSWLQGPRLAVMQADHDEEVRSFNDDQARRELERSTDWRCTWQAGTPLTLAQRIAAWPTPRTGTAEHVVQSFMADHDAPGEGAAFFRVLAHDGDQEFDFVVRAEWKQVGGRNVLWDFDFVMPFDVWGKTRNGS
jgi:hypothetical protein